MRENRDQIKSEHGYFLRSLDEAYDLWKQGSLSHLEYCFDKLKSAIQARNKLICFADKSEAGQNTVKEYI